MDVALALLIISASIMMIGYFLQADDEPADEELVDRTAETIAGSTMSVQYDTSEVKNSDKFTEPEGIEDDAAYERVDYGAALGLIGDAAVTNAELNGTTPLAYGDDYAEAVDYGVQTNLIGANDNVYIVAEWEPYDDATVLTGEMTVGERPPPDGDFSSATLSASSGIPSVVPVSSQSAIPGATVNQTVQQGSEPIAQAVIDGFFPAEDTQHSLESQGMYRELKVYHYQKLAAALDAELGDPEDGVLSRTGADVGEANDKLLWGDLDDRAYDDDLSAENITGLRDLIAHDIRTSVLEEELDELAEEPPGAYRNGQILALIEDSVSTGEVQVSIQTWEE